MTKRSPILGYNHNVRHRGLVFHVQTEDSGVLSPHLFTHLFFGGVIVATRKLVYDVGAVEDVIKNLMQAQHKAVLKDLKKGSFDDKIDQYLGGTPGLEPRETGQAEPERPSVVELTPPPAAAPAPPAPEPPAPELGPAGPARGSEQIPVPRTATTFSAVPPPPKPQAQTDRGPMIQPRTATSDRTTKVAADRQPPLPSPALDEPTLTDDAAAVAAAVGVSGATTVPTAQRTPEPPRRAGPPSRPTPVPMPARSQQPSTPPVSRTTSTVRQVMPPAGMHGDPDSADSSPEIEISLEHDSGRRGVRDTLADPTIRPGDSIPPLPPPPDSGRAKNASHGAATLPPVTRPVQRPPSRPAITPPTVVTRPVPTEDGRARRESEVIEVYAPAPPSADELPSDVPMRERAGQYSVNRAKPPSRPADAIPAGLGRPARAPSGKIPVQRHESQPIPKPIGREASPAPSADNLTARPRTPTPARTPAGGTPVTGRASQSSPGVGANPGSKSSPGVGTNRDSKSSPGTPAAARPSQSSPGVVSARPAVIVGAPPKPGSQTASRIRRAREDEGRGFGQGLISEKSLDEVILAYLSEDAEDK